MEQQLEVALPDGASLTLPVIIDAPHSPHATCGALLMHGAGGTATAGNLGDFAGALAAAGVVTVRYTLKSPNLQYRVKVCKALLGQLPALATSCAGLQRWLLCGRSMGARVACQVAHDLPHLALACILLAYPLHPPGKPQQLRDAPLVQLHLPILLVRGTKDPFSQGLQWSAMLQRLQSNRLEEHSMEGGNHGLEVKGKGGGQAPLQAACQAVTAFAASLVQGAGQEGRQALAGGKGEGGGASSGRWQQGRGGVAKRRKTERQ